MGMPACRSEPDRNCETSLGTCTVAPMCLVHHESCRLLRACLQRGIRHCMHEFRTRFRLASKVPDCNHNSYRFGLVGISPLRALHSLATLDYSCVVPCGESSL